MESLSFIKPCDLTEEQKQELNGLMTNANSMLKPLAHKMFGDRGLRKMRDEVRAGRVEWTTWDEHMAVSTTVLSSEDIDCICCLMDQESLILAGYIRVVTSLVRAFHFTTKIEMDDLWQEGAMGVYDAIYSFDGRSEFSTFVYASVKNRFINYTRAKPKHISLNTGKKHADNGNDMIDIPDHSTEKIHRIREMREIIERTPLSVQEREVIDYCLKDGTDGWQCRWAVQINLSKQRVHQLYLSAKEKIAEYSSKLAA